MVICDAHLCVIFPVIYGYDDIEGTASCQMLHLDRHVFHELLHLPGLLRGNLCDNL